MNRWFIRIAFVVAMLASTACSHAGQSSGSGTTTPFVFPAGIVPPNDWASAVRDGIYPSDSDKTCCFLAGNAQLTLANPPGSQVAVFTFYAPSVTPLKNGEHVRVRLDGVPIGPPTVLGTGMQDVNFSIPPGLRDRAHLRASLDMSVRWIPKRIGLNDDRRQLSVMLVRVVYL